MASKISDEKLSCFLDGELETTEMAQIEQALQKDAELRMRLETLAQADQLWMEALAATQDDNIPETIMDMLGEEGVAEPVNDNSGFRRWLMPIAATLAFALGVTYQTVANPGPDSAPSTVLAGNIQPDNPLFALLEHQPSAQITNFGKQNELTAKPVLTFATNDGNYCREFIVSTHISATRNVACRANDGWELLIASRTRPLSENQYRTVSAETDQAVDILIDDIIDGIPLGPDAEQALLQSSWKKNQSYRE